MVDESIMHVGTKWIGRVTRAGADSLYMLREQP